MDHRSSASADNDPFFDMLNRTTPVPSSAANFNSSFLQTNSRKGDDSEFDFGGDDLLPNYDFQPMRRSGSTNSSSRLNSSSGGRMEEGPSASNRNRHAASSRAGFGGGSTVYVTGDPSTFGPPASRREIDLDSYHSTVVSAVERTMKKYADNLLRVLEGMSGRMSQLESFTQGLEHSVSELKTSTANSHGEIDGRLRMLNNHMLEVHRAVQILRDKQEIAEAHAELVKLQLAKSEGPNKNSNIRSTVEDQTQAKQSDANQQVQVSTQQQQVPSMSAPQQPAVAQTESSLQANMQPTMPTTSYSMQLQPYNLKHAQMQEAQQQQLQMQPQPPSQLHLPPQAQIQQPLPQPTQLQQPAPQQVHISQPMPQQMQPIPQQGPVVQPLARALHVQQTMPPQPNFQAQAIQEALPLQVQPIQQPQSVSQMQGQQTPVVHPQMQPPSQGPFQQFPHQSENPSYFPLSNSSPIQAPSPPSGYAAEPSAYNPVNFGFPPSRLPSQSALLPPQQQHVQLGAQSYDSSHQRNNMPQLALQPSHVMYDTQAVVPSAGLNNSMYRVSQPHASFPGGYPSAQPVSGGSSSNGSNQPVNRVSIDEIIEKVASMGFSREQVRSVVRRLTEGGQPVDLNIVLDKLMNGGAEEQPQRGWYGR